MTPSNAMIYIDLKYKNATLKVRQTEQRHVTFKLLSPNARTKDKDIVLTFSWKTVFTENVRTISSRKHQVLRSSWPPRLCGLVFLLNQWSSG